MEKIERKWKEEAERMRKKIRCLVFGQYNGKTDIASRCATFDGILQAAKKRFMTKDGLKTNCELVKIYCLGNSEPLIFHSFEDLDSSYSMRWIEKHGNFKFYPDNIKKSLTSKD